MVTSYSSLVTGQSSLDHRQMTNDNGPVTSDGVDLLTVVMHELGHLLGYEHSADADDLMAPVLRASPLRPSSFDPRPSSDPDDVFADLGRDDSEDADGGQDAAPSLLASREDKMLAAANVKPGEETPQMRVPRRSRLQRFERELDTWFAELAAEEGYQ